MSRVLILSAGYGEGHNAAARNLVTAFNESCGAETARLVDLLEQASPRASKITRWGYLTAINRFPKLWSALYQWLDQSRPFPRALWILRRELRLLDQLIRHEKPTIICSTFPIYGFLIEKIATEHGTSIPFYNIVTDSISINSLWWLPSCDGWFLPNNESARVIIEAGRPADRVHVSGFPVQPEFAHHDSPRKEPPNLAAGHPPRVLYIINSGSARAEETARLLLAETGWEITCAVGRDEALRRRLEKHSARRSIPAKILGWTDQVPQLLMTHHAVISKAGGATTQEAIAARCPMIVNQIIPGQEEGNYELLRRHNIGAHATSPSEVIATLRSAFAQNGDIWRAWRRSLDSLSRPTAAADIAMRLAREHGIETNPIIRENAPLALSRHG